MVHLRPGLRKDTGPRGRCIISIPQKSYRIGNGARGWPHLDSGQFRTIRDNQQTGRRAARGGRWRRVTRSSRSLSAATGYCPEYREWHRPRRSNTPSSRYSGTHSVKFYVGCFLKNREASNHFLTRSSVTTRVDYVQIILGCLNGEMCWLARPSVVAENGTDQVVKSGVEWPFSPEDPGQLRRHARWLAVV